MSYTRKLHRGIDIDLVDRIEANGPVKKVKSLKAKRRPRAAHTYRGARRNERRARRLAELILKRAKAAGIHD